MPKARIVKRIKFEDYKEDIQVALKTKVSRYVCDACGDNNFVLIDGFINQPLQKELTGSIVVGGPSIPLIAVACKDCGKITYYALKALLPKTEI